MHACMKSRAPACAHCVCVFDLSFLVVHSNELASVLQSTLYCGREGRSWHVGLTAEQMIALGLFL